MLILYPISYFFLESESGSDTYFFVPYSIREPSVGRLDENYLFLLHPFLEGIIVVAPQGACLLYAVGI